MLGAACASYHSSQVRALSGSKWRLEACKALFCFALPRMALLGFLTVYVYTQAHTSILYIYMIYIYIYNIHIYMYIYIYIHYVIIS